MPFVLTLSKNRALYCMRMEDDDDPGCYNLTTEKMIRYLCSFCLGSFRCAKKLREHRLRQHLGPISCDMCSSLQEDILALKKHKVACSYPCEVEGCNILHKKIIQAMNHKKKYLKSIK